MPSMYGILRMLAFAAVVFGSVGAADPGEPDFYTSSFTFGDPRTGPLFTLSWKCSEDKKNVHLMVKAVRAKYQFDWFGIGFVGQKVDGGSKSVKMESADMAVCRVPDMKVHDYHGQSKKAPTLDLSQSLTDLGHSVLTSGPDSAEAVHDVRTWWFTRPRDAEDAEDESIAKGPMTLIYAVGYINNAGEILKHPPNSQHRGSFEFEFCEADPTTSTTTTSVTSSTTTSTTGTYTSTTTGTSTTSTTTTTLEELPNREPLAPPSVDVNGFFNFGETNGNGKSFDEWNHREKQYHDHEQGVRTSYYDMSAHPEVLGTYVTAVNAARNIAHSNTPDYVTVTPSINFPNYEAHSLGSPFKENFLTKFEGFLEVPEDGSYEFATQCSDQCEVRISCGKSQTCSPSSFQNKHLSSSTSRLFVRSGLFWEPELGSLYSTQGYGIDKKQKYILTKGTYPFWIVHLTQKVYPEKEFLEQRLGSSMVLMWKSPGSSHFRPIPARHFSHRAPVATEYRSNTHAARLVDGNLVSGHTVHGDHPDTRTAQWPSKYETPRILIDLGYVCNVTSVLVADYKKREHPIIVRVASKPFGRFRGFDNFNCTFDGMKKGGPLVRSPPPRWWSRYFATANCSGSTGRYLVIESESQFTVYGVYVNGVPVSPTPQYNAVHRWSLPPKLHPEAQVQKKNNDHMTGLPDLYRVYASVDFPGTPGTSHSRGGSEYRITEFDYYGAYRMLRERDFRDSTNWMLGDYASGSTVLDLGVEVDVAAFRMLNSHGGKYMHSGVRNLRVEAGNPGSMPVNIALASRAGVSATTTSEVAMGNACVSPNHMGKSGTNNVLKEVRVRSIGDCQALCKQTALCSMFTWRYYGVCTMHSQGFSTKANGDAVMGYRNCFAEPQDPNAAIDGNPKTCFTIPRAYETNAYWQLDLGAVHDIADILIDSNETDFDLEVYASEAKEDVSYVPNLNDDAKTRSAGYNTASMHSWIRPNTLKARCSNSFKFLGRYGKNDEGYSKYPHFGPSFKAVPVSCITRARYITIKPRYDLARTQSSTLCDVKVYHRAGASWIPVANTTLLPNVQYKDQRPNSEGLGPWVFQNLSSPVKTRYLRVSIDSHYKQRASLAAFEVLSDAPVPRFEIRSSADPTVASSAGLRAELHHIRSSGLIDPFSNVKFRAQLDRAFLVSRPGATATVPGVDFSRIYGTSPFMVRQAGSVHVGTSSAESLNISVVFDLPFDMLPVVEVAMHRKLVGKQSAITLSNKAQISTEFRMVAVDVTRAGFTLHVERTTTSGTVGWNFVEEFHSMPLAAEFAASAPFPEFKTRFGTVDTRDVSEPSTDYTTKGWKNHVLFKFSGELVAEVTAKYTLHLTGTPFVRLLVDNEEVAFGSNLHDYGTTVDSNVGKSTKWYSYADFGGDTTCSVLQNGTRPRDVWGHVSDTKSCEYYVAKNVNARVWTELAWLNVSDAEPGLSDDERAYWTALGMTEERWTPSEWHGWSDFSLSVFGKLLPLWKDLSAAQKEAAKALGYGILGWGRSWIFRERFVSRRKGASASVGWGAGFMTQEEVSSLQALGWTSRTWTAAAVDHPDVLKNSWEQLSSAEQHAAEALGFVQSTWIPVQVSDYTTRKICAYDTGTLESGYLEIPAGEQVSRYPDLYSKEGSAWPRPTARQPLPRFHIICGQAVPSVVTTETVLELVAGKPVKIEIQSTNGRRGGVHAVKFMWSRPGIGMQVVPSSALRHRSRDSCLAFQHASNRATMVECDAESPYQKWRLDGKFIRPAGQGSAFTSTLQKGDLSSKCLFSDNAPWNEYTKYQSEPFCRGSHTSCRWSLQECQRGGIYPTRLNMDGVYYTELSRKYTSTYLWDVNMKKGTIKSLSRRPPRSGAQTACPEMYTPKPTQYNAAYPGGVLLWEASRKYIEYSAAMRCEAEREVEPFMCISADVTKSGANEIERGMAVNLKPCESPPPNAWSSQAWQITRSSDFGKHAVTSAFGGMYDRWPHTYKYIPAKSRLSGVAWGHKVTCTDTPGGCPHCDRGSTNNTCTFACDGLCSEPGRENNYGSADCAIGTDSYDCESKHPLHVCADICLRREDCSAFMTGSYEQQYRGAVSCYFISYDYISAWENTLGLEHVEYYTFYRKTKAAEANTKGIPNMLQPCSSFAADVCPETRCERATVAERSDKEGPLQDQSIVGHGLEDPLCADTNTWPASNGPFFSCEQYKEISQQEIDSYNRAPELALCNKPYVASICAITCNHTDFCPATAYECVDAALTRTATAAPKHDAKAAEEECGDASKLINGRCRCAQDYVCKDTAGSTGCFTSTAGNGRSTAHWYYPSNNNTTAECVLKPGAKLESTPAPTIGRVWTTIAWSSTTTTATTATTTTSTTTTVSSTTTLAITSTPDLVNADSDTSKSGPGGAIGGAVGGTFFLIFVGVAAAYYYRQQLGSNTSASNDNQISSKLDGDQIAENPRFAKYSAAIVNPIYSPSNASDENRRVSQTNLASVLSNSGPNALSPSIMEFKGLGRQNSTSANKSNRRLSASATGVTNFQALLDDGGVMF